MYGGALGKKVIERLTELGGCLTMDDLLDVKADWIDPVAVDLSRPHHPRAAAALRGVPVPADPAHPRRLRPRQAAAQRHRAYRHRAARHPHRGRRAHRQRRALASRSSPSSCRTAMSRACGRACATASRSTGRPSNGRAPATEGHTTSFSIADKRRQHGVRDAEPGQRVRLGRRRARHRRLPQQLPLLGRRQPAEPQPREAGRRHADLRGALDRHRRTTSRCWRWARPAATASCRPRCRPWCSTSISACRCSRRSRRRARG